MTTVDVTQKIIEDITARYTDAQATNKIPDTWELVGLAVQLIENQEPPKLTGQQKMTAVKQIVAGVIQQLPIPDGSKEHLQQTLFRVENLVEVSLQLIARNEQLSKSCLSCLGSTAKKIHLPFPIVQA